MSELFVKIVNKNTTEKLLIMESLIEDVLPRIIPQPTQVAQQSIQPGMICVPEVSLLDPDELPRTGGDNRISYKLWRKQKVPQAPKAIPTMEYTPPAVVNQAGAAEQSSGKCCADRIHDLSSTVDRQQLEISALRSENSAMKKDIDELRARFLELSKLLLRGDEEAPETRPTDAKRKEQPCVSFIPVNSAAHSGRWSLPGDSSDCLESPRAVLGESNAGRAPPDKSQMLNNLFKKYFPQAEAENVSPSNVPILEYHEERSMATVNYLAKYKLLSGEERVLDISKLKKQSKLF